MIKSTIILGAMCTLFTADLYSQSSDTRGNVDFGVKAGLNVSNVWDTRGDAFRADAKIGYAAGVFLGIPLGQVFGLQPEVLISQKGFQGSGSLLGFPYSFSRTTTFVDIPLQLQIKPVQYITFVAGPQFSYLINKKD
jgi:hypothetical protein